MSAPERIWIDAWGGNWSPLAGGTQTGEYIHADTVAEMIRQAVQAEREACAVITETMHETSWPDTNTEAVKTLFVALLDEAHEDCVFVDSAVGVNDTQVQLDRIAAARDLIPALLKERDEALAKLAVAAEALKHYRETLCEGFCKGDVWADEGHSHPDIQRDCGGCLAASVLINCATLTQIKGDE